MSSVLVQDRRQILWRSNEAMSAERLIPETRVGIDNRQNPLTS
ncbi:MAG: hypothetical protein WBE49_11485 [Methylovirgula sp.]